MNIPNPYVLPPMDFVSGSTQDLVFHCYFYANHKPIDLSTCTANFSIINFVNKNGDPLISKRMSIGTDYIVDGDIQNVLRVTLDSADTISLLAGKYIYQISIRDITGDVDIPKQGIIHIINNIDKPFLS